MGLSFIFSSFSLDRFIPGCFNRKKILSFFFTLVFFTSSFSQNKNLHFEHISVEQGLSQSIVTSIIQDKNGFLWFGTEDGLNRYDGYQFKIFKHNPGNPSSISDNGIMCLYKDKQNNIWIGTDKRGLNKYDYRTGKFVHIDYDKDFAISKVNSICDDIHGNLWVGTDRGLFQYSRDKKLVKKFIHNPNYTNSLSNSIIRAVLIDRNNDLWIGTENGLNKFNQNDNTFARYFFSSSKNKNNFPISTLFEDKEGFIWVGTFSNGLIRLDSKTGEFEFFKNKSSFETSLSSDDVRKIFEDMEGNLWIGTANGLNRFVSRKNSFIRYFHMENDYKSLSCNEVISIFQDNDGIMWIGTFSGGINKLDLKQETFFHYTHKSDDPNSISENYVTSVTEDKDGNIWVGTNLMGLNKLDKNTGRFNHFVNAGGCVNCISQNTVLALHNRYSNYLWIGTYLSGLCRYDISTGKFTSYPVDPNCNSYSTTSGTVYSVLEDNNNNVWVGTRNGLSKLNLETNNFTHYLNSTNKNSISDNLIISLFCDDENILWIGTVRGGLNRLDTKTNTITRFINNPKSKNSISSNRVQAIFEMPGDSKVIWIGTDQGLNTLEKSTGRFLNNYFDKNSELNDISVFAITADDKRNLWLNTNKGIIKFNPNTNYTKRFTANDGLIGNEFDPNAWYKDKNGFLYFGGPAGLNVFHPDNIKLNTYAPPIVLTSFKKFNREVKFDRPINEVDSINLTYEDYVISFEFAALSFAQPDLNRYAYHLDGFDKNWVYTDASKRFATYTNLEPGNYILRIRASNNDGLWGKNETSIFIFIKPPFWENLFFKIAIFLVLLILVFLYVNSKMKKINLERQRQNQFSKLLIESQEDERRRLSKELHDSLGQNLLVIKNLLHLYQSTEKREDKELENISEIIKDTIVEVKEISTTLHPHQLERLGLKKALIAMINKISQSVDTVFTSAIDDISGLIPKEEEINIFRIVQESLNNIIKHSKAVNATVSIINEVSQIRITVEDDGKGFDFSGKVIQNKLNEGLGLKSIGERARLLNGEFKIESMPGKGTKIIIIIKKIVAQ